MSNPRSPVTWFGGKGRMARHILPLFPDHKIYVEPFGGGASMLFAKSPAPLEVYNDLDQGLVNFFRVLRDRDKAAQLYMKVAATPYSRFEYEECKTHWSEEKDEVERAYRWFIVDRMSFAAVFGNSWGMSRAPSSSGTSQTVNRFYSATALIGWAQQRMERVQVDCQDFRKLIPAYDSVQTLFYLDPPYVPETRKSGEYKHELHHDDHVALVDLVLSLEGMCVLSGYDNEIYSPLMKAGWKRHAFDVPCNAVGRTKAAGLKGDGSLKEHRRTEMVWVSPSCSKCKHRGAPKLMPVIHGLRMPGVAA